VGTAEEARAGVARGLVVGAGKGVCPEAVEVTMAGAARDVAGWVGVARAAAAWVVAASVEAATASVASAAVARVGAGMEAADCVSRSANERRTRRVGTARGR
jgi:hypothetical protein